MYNRAFILNLPGSGVSGAEIKNDKIDHFPL